MEYVPTKTINKHAISEDVFIEFWGDFLLYYAKLQRTN